ncbi:hypothetical protein M0R45_037091 [Rubus argutus]|uniref:Uncharacterized protein n=1 Tax=Rubus argutus TaxID=59490 RepID=A0AAW1VY14_RUBAR
MKFKVGRVVVVVVAVLLVSTSFAPTTFAVRRKNYEVASVSAAEPDPDPVDDDGDKTDGCGGSKCNMFLAPCKAGCICVPIGVLPVGFCAGMCCDSPSPPSLTPLSQPLIPLPHLSTPLPHSPTPAAHPPSSSSPPSSDALA